MLFARELLRSEKELALENINLILDREEAEAESRAVQKEMVVTAVALDDREKKRPMNFTEKVEKMYGAGALRKFSKT